MAPSQLPLKGGKNCDWHCSVAGAHLQKAMVRSARLAITCSALSRRWTPADTPHSDVSAFPRQREPSACRWHVLTCRLAGYDQTTHMRCRAFEQRASVQQFWIHEHLSRRVAMLRVVQRDSWDCVFAMCMHLFGAQFWQQGTCSCPWLTRQILASQAWVGWRPGHAIGGLFRGLYTVVTCLKGALKCSVTLTVLGGSGARAALRGRFWTV